MSLHLVLKNFNGLIVTGSSEWIPAGAILDDTLINVAALKAAGCPMTPWTATAAQVQARNAFISRDPNQGPSLPSENLPDLLTSFNAIIDSQAARLIFRPGGIPGGEVFTTWASLITAYQMVEASLVVVFDDTLAPIILPAGLWAVPYDMIWAGWHIGITTQVTLADGFQLTNSVGAQSGLTMLTDDITVHTQASSLGSNVSPIEVIAQDVIVIQYGSKIVADGDLPLISVLAGATLIIPLYLAGEILFGATPVAAVALGGTIIVFSPTFGTVQPGTFSGAGTLFTVIAVVNPNIHTTAAEQPGVTGAVTTQLATEAHFCGYIPANAGDWIGNPVNAGEALDRLAAAVAGLLGGPIP